MEINLLETKNGTPLLPFYLAGAVVLALCGYLANTRIQHLSNEWEFLEKHRIAMTKKITYSTYCQEPRAELEAKIQAAEGSFKNTNRFDLQKVYSYGWTTHETYKIAKEIHDSDLRINETCKRVNEMLTKEAATAPTDYVMANFFNDTKIDYIGLAKYD
jgi:hypothetical protein